MVEGKERVGKGVELVRDGEFEGGVGGSGGVCGAGRLNRSGGICGSGCPILQHLIGEEGHQCFKSALFRDEVGDEVDPFGQEDQLPGLNQNEIAFIVFHLEGSGQDLGDGVGGDISLVVLRGGGDLLVEDRSIAIHQERIDGWVIKEYMWNDLHAEVSKWNVDLQGADRMITHKGGFLF